MLGAILSNPQLADKAMVAVGMTTADIRSLRDTRIPIWSVILVSAVVGSVVALRYCPETWAKGMREIGK